MSARSKARKRALDIVFEADSKGVSIRGVLAEHIRRRVSDGSPPLNEYSVTLAEGVAQNLAEIDASIDAHATGWSLARMPDVDRAIARIATYEILFEAEVPGPVAISEAIELARQLSTDDSPVFLAGMLNAIYGVHVTTEAAGLPE